MTTRTSHAGEYENGHGAIPPRDPQRPVGIALLGYGTVGSEVMRLFTENAESLEHRVEGPVELKGVAVSDISKPRPGVAPDLLTQDALGLVTRDDVDVVVEVIGGIDYPRTVVLAAMQAGKSVVTANKALVAAHADELAQAADDNGVDLYYEAAVAAAIPVVGMLRRSLAGDQIRRISGIVNGTTNYILDAMDSTGASYEEALAEATRLGYAEADPTADVEGHDAASKAAILSSMAFHTRVTFADVTCTGITHITAEDIEAAREAGATIKLLAVCEKVLGEDGTPSVSARVHPALVSRDHPLASVSESYNAVFVEAEAAGDLMFYGNGAGGAPTASAVLGDVVGAARNKHLGGRAPKDLTYARLPLADPGEVPTRFHIDLRVLDRVGVLAELARTCADRGISLRTVRQEEGYEVDSEQAARLILVTHTAKERDLTGFVESLKANPDVLTVNSVIRLAE